MSMSTKKRTDLNEAYDTLARAYKNIGSCFEDIAQAQRGLDDQLTITNQTHRDDLIPYTPKEYLLDIAENLQEICGLHMAIKNAQATCKRLIDTEEELYDFAL